MEKKTIRRSQLISPWGIGQMINFPGDESLMVCGLDVWEQEYNKGRDGVDEWIIREERLETRLNVKEFRSPPEYREANSSGVKNPSLRIPCVRFPLWHYCPWCGSMEKLGLYGGRQKCKGPNYNNGMSCHKKPERKRPFMIPVRFVTVCEHGHIEDFPFMEWVHREEKSNSLCKLRLRTGRNSSSLSGIILNCSCGTDSRTLSGAFNDNSLKGIKECSGNRPWLGEIDDQSSKCGNNLKVVQKGASNVYFPITRSSIYLPKWKKEVDKKIVDILERNWSFLTQSLIDGELNRVRFEILAEQKSVDFEKLITAAMNKLNIVDAEKHIEDQDYDSEELYRYSEYRAILSGQGGDNQDFYVTNQKGDEYDHTVKDYFKSINLMHKLRETRAMVGFTRILPEDGIPLSEKIGELTLNKSIDWLPAIIVRGEGIFFEVDEDKISEWIERPNVINRVAKLVNHHIKFQEERGLSESRNPFSPKYVLLHTLAHLLINQFSYECGYGSSALRERIYCNHEYPNNMNGILIYTASGDTEGSLGGLVRQGKPGYLENIVANAINSSRWCSSDPVCMESEGQGPNSCNLAACHSCTLLPETSCEHGNKVLDRALISGTLDDPSIGFFNRYEEYIY
jgi:hypothetical protein